MNNYIIQPNFPTHSKLDSIQEEMQRSQYQLIKSNAQLQTANIEIERLNTKIEEQTEIINRLKIDYENAQKLLEESEKKLSTRDWKNMILSPIISGIIGIIIGIIAKSFWILILQ